MLEYFQIPNFKCNDFQIDYMETLENTNPDINTEESNAQRNRQVRIKVHTDTFLYDEWITWEWQVRDQPH